MLDKFHKYFNEIWEWRLQNMKSFTREMHQLICHLSIVDYYFKNNLYQNNIQHLRDDYHYIKQRRQPCNRYINYRVNKCIEIMEPYIVMDKLLGE